MALLQLLPHSSQILKVIENVEGKVWFEAKNRRSVVCPIDFGWRELAEILMIAVREIPYDRTAFITLHYQGAAHLEASITSTIYPTWNFEEAHDYS